MGIDDLQRPKNKKLFMRSWLVFLFVLIITFICFRYWHLKGEWLDHWFLLAAELLVGFAIIAEVNHAIEATRDERQQRHEQEMQRFSKEFLDEVFGPHYSMRSNLYKAFADSGSDLNLNDRRIKFTAKIRTSEELREIADTQLTHITKSVLLAGQDRAKLAMVVLWHPHTFVRLWVMCGLYWCERHSDPWSWGVAALVVIRESLKHLLRTEQSVAMRIANGSSTEHRLASIGIKDLQDLLDEIDALEGIEWTAKKSRIRISGEFDFTWKGKAIWDFFRI